MLSSYLSKFNYNIDVHFLKCRKSAVPEVKMPEVAT